MSSLIPLRFCFKLDYVRKFFYRENAYQLVVYFKFKSVPVRWKPWHNCGSDPPSWPWLKTHEAPIRARNQSSSISNYSNHFQAYRIPSSMAVLPLTQVLLKITKLCWLVLYTCSCSSFNSWVSLLEQTLFFGDHLWWWSFVTHTHTPYVMLKSKCWNRRKKAKGLKRGLKRGEDEGGC